MRELTTDRLNLRRIREDDTQRIFDCWASRPEVTKYLTWHAHESVEQTKMVMGFWLKEYAEDPNCMRWGIELRATGELIGMIDVVGFHHGNPVIGYCSGPDYWGNGYMTEALRAVVNELFATGYEEIVIGAMADNIGSNRVIEKAGFMRIGTFERQQSQWKPEIVKMHEYRLRRE